MQIIDSSILTKHKMFFFPWNRALKMPSIPIDPFTVFKSRLLLLLHPITEFSCALESCCQMRTLDSGIGTFPLPDSGNRSAGRHVSKQELTLETEALAPSEQVLLSAPSVKAKTLEREVPSTAMSQESVESIISHSTSDPAMTAKGIRPFQSRLPKPDSSGKMSITLKITLFLSRCLFRLAEVP